VIIYQLSAKRKGQRAKTVFALSPLLLALCSSLLNEKCQMAVSSLKCNFEIAEKRQAAVALACFSTAKSKKHSDELQTAYPRTKIPDTDTDQRRVHPNADRAATGF